MVRVDRGSETSSCACRYDSLPVHLYPRLMSRLLAQKRYFLGGTPGIIPVWELIWREFAPHSLLPSISHKFHPLDSGRLKSEHQQTFQLSITRMSGVN